jgi:hypothetical protein
VTWNLAGKSEAFNENITKQKTQDRKLKRLPI